MQLFQNPLFRDVILFLAIVLLIVFCVDKSRQNVRTRNALYNCVYALYGAAVVKLIQILDKLMDFGWGCQVMGLAIVAGAAMAYAKWLGPKDDIPYNQLFRSIGWLILLLTAIMQMGFLYLALVRQ
jgi:hypothetical protein